MKARKSRLPKAITIMVWSIISIVFQVSILYSLEHIADGASTPAQAPVSTIQTPASATQVPEKANTVVTLPSVDATKLQASYSKDYIAYSDDKGLEVVNVKTSKLVFTENRPQGGKILAYCWLPDRNTLLYVMTKPQSTAAAKPQERITKKDPKTGKPVAQLTNNLPATEIYTADFGPADEEVNPDRKLARKLDGFPAAAQIEAIDLSTYTNIIYIQAKTTSGQIMYEIDVMKNVRTVQRTGEKITALAASDKKGTLYMQSTLTGISQIIAVKQNSRLQLLKGAQYVLLGASDGKVLVGDVEGGMLVKIFSLPDTGSKEAISTTKTLEWQGSISWDNYKAVTASKDFWVLYNENHGIAFEQGNPKQIDFSAKTDYLTGDGKEIMQVSPNGSNTSTVTIKPL